MIDEYLFGLYGWLCCRERERERERLIGTAR